MIDFILSARIVIIIECQNSNNNFVQNRDNLLLSFWSFRLFSLLSSLCTCFLSAFEDYRQSIYAVSSPFVFMIPRTGFSRQSTVTLSFLLIMDGIIYMDGVIHH